MESVEGRMRERDRLSGVVVGEGPSGGGDERTGEDHGDSGGVVGVGNGEGPGVGGEGIPGEDGAEGGEDEDERELHCGGTERE